PDGGAIALMEAPAEVSVIATDRQWARVRLEGWVRATDVLDATSARPAITAAMLRENPERYVGQAVQWRGQVLAPPPGGERRRADPHQGDLRHHRPGRERRQGDEGGRGGGAERGRRGPPGRRAGPGRGAAAGGAGQGGPAPGGIEAGGARRCLISGAPGPRVE